VGAEGVPLLDRISAAAVVRQIGHKSYIIIKVNFICKQKAPKYLNFSIFNYNSNIKFNINIKQSILVEEALIFNIKNI
jgi:hypothetical protein